MNNRKFKRLAVKSLKFEPQKKEGFEQYQEDTPLLDLSEFDYLLVPLDSVKNIIREHGMSCDECDEICIKQDAPIILAKKGQKLL